MTMPQFYLLNFSATQSPNHFYIWSHMSSTRLIDTNDVQLLFICPSFHFDSLFSFLLLSPSFTPTSSLPPAPPCEVPRISLDFRVQSSTARKVLVITSQSPDMGFPVMSGIHIPRSFAHFGWGSFHCGYPSLANMCLCRYTTFTNRDLQVNIHDGQHYPRVFHTKKWPALSFKASITLCRECWVA